MVDAAVNTVSEIQPTTRIIQSDDSNEYRYGKWHGKARSADLANYVITNSPQKVGETLSIPGLDDGQTFGVLLDKGRLALFSFTNGRGELSVECRKVYRVYRRSDNKLVDCFFGSTFLFKGAMKEMFIVSSWCTAMLASCNGSLS